MWIIISIIIIVISCILNVLSEPDTWSYNPILDFISTVVEIPFEQPINIIVDYLKKH